MLEQGTKPGTISLALMSNPLALLAWCAIHIEWAAMIEADWVTGSAG
jgi:hypothetical protein